MHRPIPLLLLSFALAGCAADTAPISPDHPAHPDAPAAPLPPLSSTLALSPVAADANASAPATTASATTYACPMHPKVTSSTPGKCPECGMALKPVGAGRATVPMAVPATQPVTGHESHDHGGHP